jgi:hypothetical protein
VTSGARTITSGAPFMGSAALTGMHHRILVVAVTMAVGIVVAPLAAAGMTRATSAAVREEPSSEAAHRPVQNGTRATLAAGPESRSAGTDHAFVRLGGTP